MNSADDGWLSLLLIALFGALLVLRFKFPNVSRKAETTVLLVATILFFSICNFLKPHESPQVVQEIIQTRR